MTTTRLLLVRHGATDWARDRRHTGRTDIPLNETGRAQAHALRDQLPLSGLTTLWCSPLARARETAELAGLTTLPGATIDPDLQEWDYGEAEGRTTAEIRAEHAGWDVWTHGVRNGESVNQVGERTDRVIARARQVDGTIALVAHAHLLRILAARWLGLPPVAGRHLVLDPAGWALLGWERETPVIERWNPPA